MEVDVVGASRSKSQGSGVDVAEVATVALAELAAEEVEYWRVG